MFSLPTTAISQRIWRSAPCFFLLVALLASTQICAQRIDRVEPPSWWLGMQHDTVELLISGRDLAASKARFDRPGPVIIRQEAGASPNHTFLTLHLPENCQPGNYRLSLTGLRGAASVVFPVLERLPTQDRHQGFGPADVLYLITPDRFADGSTANNYGDTPDHLPPATEPGAASLSLEFDPHAPGAWHGGDLMGIIQRLPYLADLGITTLWINPFLENAGPGSYHGYAATNLYQVDPRFGSNDVYAELVEAAHLKGLKVVFDHVNNHVGVFHPWVADPPTASWFHGTVAEHERDPHHLPALLAPNAASGLREQVYTGWFADAMPDLNQADPHVARYLIQQSIWWVEFSGMDGIREDTYPYVYPSFSAAWLRALAREYPRLTVVGECWGNTLFTAMFQKDAPAAQIQIKQQQNDRSAEPRLDALSVVMDFGFMNAMDRFLRGQSNLYPVYERLAEDALFADPSMLVTFLGNHDMARAIDRADGDAERHRLALFTLLTMRGIPQLFYGEEIGLRALGDPDRHEDLRRDFPGGFPYRIGPSCKGELTQPPPRSAFSAEGRVKTETAVGQSVTSSAGGRGTSDSAEGISAAEAASGRTPEEEAMHAFTRQLLHLRRENTALQQGTLTQLTPRWDGAWAWLREDTQQQVLCAVHTQGGVLEHPYLAPLLGDKSLVLRNLLTEERKPFGPGDELALPAMGVSIWVVEGH